jgi:bifunctional DNA-binding transcriptional regulator/antitoxin component of YhaV-PrlF toxin-antitoxin module
LVKLGEGPVYGGYKIYVPKTVFDHLKLKPKDKVEYFLILDPNHKDLIIIKKA